MRASKAPSVSADPAKVLARFPKTRPPLPSEYAAIHRAQYENSRRGETLFTSLSLRMESWLHRQVAQDLMQCCGELSTLEIGAGTLNQLAFEPNVGPYDIVEPFAALYEGAEGHERIRHIYCDIRDVPSDARYERITSIATFEHICDLPDVIAGAGLRLSGGGTLRVAIPSEGTPLWRLGWQMTTGLEFRLRRGLNYEVLLRHEHVNAASEIETLLSYFFNDISMNIFGVSRWLSLYQFYECRDPVAERCEQFSAACVVSPIDQ